METSLKTGFAQIFSCCPKNLSRPKFGGAAAPLAPPARTPMRLSHNKLRFHEKRRGTGEIHTNIFVATCAAQKIDLIRLTQCCN